jgi:hypothetical protein
MNFIVQLYLSDIRRVIALFIVSGLFAYFVDYRYLKDKKEYAREKKFAKAVSYFYFFGGTLAFLAINILNWFV